jgi:hypothetical protein
MFIIALIRDMDVVRKKRPLDEELVEELDEELDEEPDELKLIK